MLAYKTSCKYPSLVLWLPFHSSWIGPTDVQHALQVHGMLLRTQVCAKSRPSTSMMHQPEMRFAESHPDSVVNDG